MLTTIPTHPRFYGDNLDRLRASHAASSGNLIY